LASRRRSDTLRGMAGRMRGNGEGTISKRKDGRWVARYYIRTAAGPKRKALYARSRVEAATMLARAIAERDGSGPITAEPSKVSLSEYFLEWLAAKRPELAADTYRGYESTVEHRLVPALGSLKLAELRRVHIEHFLAHLRSEGLAPSTIRHVMAVLSAALNQAVAWELLASNPATNVRRPKDRSQKMRALSEEEAARLMAAVRGTRRETLYDVALTLGPRQGELRGLRWSDFSDHTLTITCSVSTDYGVAWGPTKTGEDSQTAGALGGFFQASPQGPTTGKGGGSFVGRSFVDLPEHARERMATPGHVRILQARSRSGRTTQRRAVPRSAAYQCNAHVESRSPSERRLESPGALGPGHDVKTLRTCPARHAADRRGRHGRLCFLGPLASSWYQNRERRAGYSHR
jgi:hypothetical protein